MDPTAVPGTYPDTPAGQTVSLDFRSSTGTAPLSYSSSVTGPGSATLNNTSSSHPTLHLPANVGGVYTVSLTVTNASGATNTATTTIGAQVQCVVVSINGVNVYKPVQLV